MADWSDLKFKLITTGDETGTWGITTNENLGTAIQQAITGSADISFADTNKHLYLTDSTAAQDARALRLRLTGTVSTTRTLYIPNIQKFYILDNELTEAITVQNEVGTGATLTIPAGRSTLVFNTATDIVNPNTYFAGAVLSDAAVILGGAINNTPIGSITPSTGDFSTLHGTDITATNPIPISSGGTGSATATGTGSVVLSSSPTITNPSLAGTPITPTATAGTNTTQIASTAFVTGAVTTLSSSLGTMATQNSDNVNISGGAVAASTVTGTLGANHGGTGAATLSANAVLLGNGTSAVQTVAPSTTGNVLTSNGTTWASSALAVLGVGQSYTTFTTTTRVYGTTYTNSTGKPIYVIHGYGRNENADVSVNGVIIAHLSHDSNNNTQTFYTFIVPNGSTYGIAGTYSNDSVQAVSYWNELR